MSRTTKKWVLENYTKGEILKRVPKTRIKEDTYDLYNGGTVADLLNYFDVPPEEISIEVGTWYDYTECKAVRRYTDFLSEEERLDIGIKAIQQATDIKEAKQKQIERKKKELEKLMKEVEG